MTKRTTEQQRARELQRTAHEQGTHLSYHEALNWVRATAEAQAENPDEIVAFAPHATCIMIFDADEDPEYIRDSSTDPRSRSRARQRAAPAEKRSDARPLQGAARSHDPRQVGCSDRGSRALHQAGARQ
ncbi:hypothetical protein GCM10010416_19410 [Streptomyces caniferus]|uniref:hypothetical protein n=1 Tax=Streptomyces caniferus TaxID=285557 RepID=UPI0031E089DE